MLCLNLSVLLSFWPTRSVLDTQKEVFPGGVVVDTVHCLRSPKQSYALYLPLHYSNQKEWPVLFLYDPAARGKLTVGRYADLAEQFQLILICSNNARNGPIAPSLESAESVTHDVLSRFSVDKERILISGFSGGSRLAMLVASESGSYAGIIACGAGFFPNARLPLSAPIPYIELVGNRDPNFDEALEVDRYLNDNHYPHRVHYFEGGHEWPSPDEYRQGLFWQWMHFRKKDRSGFPYEDYAASIIPTLKSQIDSGDFYLAFLNTQQGLSALLPGRFSRIYSIKRFLEGNPLLRFQTDEFPKLRESELQFREDWNRQFGKLTQMEADSSFNNSDWTPPISTIKRLKKSGSHQKKVLSDRLSGVMTLVCNEQYNNQFKSKDYLHAVMSARVLSLVENSSRSYYLLARAWAARGIKNKSLDALAKAIELGLHEKKMVEEDPFLMPLQNEPRYNNLLRKLD